METTKKCLIVTILILSFVICGCTAKYPQEESNLSEEGTDREAKNSMLYIGELFAVNPNDLKIIDISITENSCVFGNRNYTNISDKVKPNYFTSFWGWQIDLSALNPLGKTTDNQIVYAQKDTDDTILSLVVSDAEKNLTWFYDEKSSVFDAAVYSFDDFVVSPYSEQNNNKDNRNSYQQIWQAHCLPRADGKEYMPLDGGDMDLYSLILLNKSHPELSYVLVYGYFTEEICGLYIYNLHYENFILFSEFL